MSASLALQVLEMKNARDMLRTRTASVLPTWLLKKRVQVMLGANRCRAEG